MANTCDDAFQEIQSLQQRQQELRRQLDESERARKAGEVFTRAEVGNKILLPGRDGTTRELDDKELSRGLQQLADTLESHQLDAFVERAPRSTFSRAMAPSSTFMSLAPRAMNWILWKASWKATSLIRSRPPTAVPLIWMRSSEKR